MLRKVLGYALALAAAIYVLWPWLPGTRPFARSIVVYGFSILGETMNEGIFPAFAERWHARTGQRVEFISSFAGSGTVTNQILLGVPAQVAILSLELDAMKLEQAGITSGWRALPHQGTVNRTPFVILVRPGNPKQIQDFDSLTRAGVGVVHPDPLTSGGAQWAVLAEYGAAVRRGQDPRQELLGIWKNVVAQSASARGARTQFDGGFGDALITYEQELLHDIKRGRLKGEIVYPRSTILSEHTVVVIERNILPADRELVRAFVDFLWTPEAQRIFVEYGFRSMDEALMVDVQGFGKIQEPFLVSDLGGWSKAKADIVEAVWKQTVLPELGK